MYPISTEFSFPPVEPDVDHRRNAEELLHGIVLAGISDESIYSDIETLRGALKREMDSGFPTLERLGIPDKAPPEKWQVDAEDPSPREEAEEAIEQALDVLLCGDAEYILGILCEELRKAKTSFPPRAPFTRCPFHYAEQSYQLWSVKTYPMIAAGDMVYIFSDGPKGAFREQFTLMGQNISCETEYHMKRRWIDECRTKGNNQTELVKTRLGPDYAHYVRTDD